jgi:hypothetical protein
VDGRARRRLTTLGRAAAVSVAARTSAVRAATPSFWQRVCLAHGETGPRASCVRVRRLCARTYGIVYCFTKQLRVRSVGSGGLQRMDLTCEDPGVVD